MISFRDLLCEELDALRDERIDIVGEDLPDYDAELTEAIAQVKARIAALDAEKAPEPYSPRNASRSTAS